MIYNITGVWEAQSLSKSVKVIAWASKAPAAAKAEGQAYCSKTLRTVRQAFENAAAFCSAMALPRFCLRFMPLAFGLIQGQKIKVAQGCSRWIKVDQGILKHFFMRCETSFKPPQAQRLRW